MESFTMTHARLVYTLVTILICSTFFGSSFANPTTQIDTEQQQLTDLASKVDNIGEKLDALSDTVNTKLDILIDQESQTDENTASETTPGESTPPPSSVVQVDSLNTPPVQVLSVERAVIPSGNEFKVRFRKTIELEDLVTGLYNLDSPRKEADGIEEEGNGVWVATFIFNTEERKSIDPWIFLSEKADYMVGMEVTPDESSPAFQDSLHIPVLNIQPANNIAYEPGQNVVVEASIPYVRNEGEDDPYLGEFFSGIDLETGEYQLTFDDMHLVNSTAFLEQGETMEQTFTVLTATHHVSGILQLTTSYGASTEDSFVKEVQVMRHIEIYPSNQSGFLPEGYLTIADIPHMEKSDNNRTLFVCRVDIECTPNCYGIGEKISDLEVYEILPGGGRQPVASQLTSQPLNHFITAAWTVQADEDSGDSNGIITFECRALDQTNRKIVSTLVDVQATVPSIMDHERSSFEIEDDPTDPEKKRVTLNCAVKGRPLPEVVFTNGSSDFFPMAGDPADYVTPSGENEAIATKVMTFDASALNSSESDFMVLYEPAVQCGFFSALDFSYHTHIFDLRSYN